MIERLWQVVVGLRDYLAANFDPVRDTIDIVVVTLGIYWLLLLIRGTRAVQILVGLLVLLAASVASELFQLVTLRLVLQNFLSSAVVIMIVLFQNDIRRALARVGRGVFPSVNPRQEFQLVDEIARATHTLAQKRVGALIVLERETNLDDQVEAGVTLDALVTKDLLTSIFYPVSPLHDGAVLIKEGRLAKAGCVLPLALKTDLPEGVGTRHRAAAGITEENDAVVVVVSEETGTLSVVVRGEMERNLDAAGLRDLLRDLMSGGRADLSSPAEARPAEGAQPAEALEAAPADPAGAAESAPASARSAG